MSQLGGQLLRDDQYMALGQIAVASAKAEAALDHMICNLTRLSPLKAEIIMDRKMIDAKFTTVKLLAQLKIKDDAKKHELGVLVGKCQDANTDRNTMLHGMWHKDESKKDNALRALYYDGAVVYKKTSPGNYKAMAGSEITLVALKVEKTLWDLIFFLEDELKLKPWLPTLAPKRLKAKRSQPRKAAKSR